MSFGDSRKAQYSGQNARSNGDAGKELGESRVRRACWGLFLRLFIFFRPTFPNSLVCTLDTKSIKVRIFRNGQGRNEVKKTPSSNKTETKQMER